MTSWHIICERIDFCKNRKGVKLTNFVFNDDDDLNELLRGPLIFDVSAPSDRLITHILVIPLCVFAPNLYLNLILYRLTLSRMRIALFEGVGFL